MKDRKKYDIPAEDWIRVWSDAKTLEEVCEKFDCDKTYASLRSCRYRRNGVPLKKFHPDRRMNWYELAKLAQKEKNDDD